MDHTQLLHALQNNIPTEIWYLIPLLILAAVIKSPWFKGRAGEALVNLSAKLFELLKNIKDFEIQVQGPICEPVDNRRDNFIRKRVVVVTNVSIEGERLQADIVVLAPP